MTAESPIYDAVAVGAGPAGSAAATLLAAAGKRVLLLEKDHFPRAKVCGEFLSTDALPSLERLGARNAVESARPERIDRGSLHLLTGPAVLFRLPAQALGISRYCLDDLLAKRAREAGAEVRFGARVLSIEGGLSERFRIRCSGSHRDEEIRSRAVIGAWGRWDALDRAFARGFLSRRERFFGWSRDYDGDTSQLAGEVRLYLFRGGYCGLSRVEGGAANLAGVVSEKTHRRAGGGWTGVLEHARQSNPHLDVDLSRMSPGPIGFLGTGPVFFTSKPPAENGMLMAGDAAGVIDPFSGEGQSSALASGILAAETVLRLLAGDLSPRQHTRAYAKAWKKRFGKRFAWSAFFRRMVLSPGLGNLAARVAGERLIRFAIAATSETSERPLDAARSE